MPRTNESKQRTHPKMLNKIKNMPSFNHMIKDQTNNSNSFLEEK